MPNARATSTALDNTATGSFKTQKCLVYGAGKNCQILKFKNKMAAKKCHRWLDEEVIAFLKLYKNMECLWNTRLRDHKDRNKRERSYEAIKNKLGLEDLTVLDIKNKIRGIRTTYSDELNKIVSSIKFGESDVYKPKVFWFNIADSFLRGVTKNGLGTTIRKKEESSFSADEPLQHQDTEEDLDFSDNANLIDLPPLLPERRSPETNTLNPALVSKEEDEYDLFGRSMAMQLRKMPELTALELMQKMQLMVLNSRKQLSNRKIKTKQRLMKPVLNMPSTSNTNSNRPRSPSPDASSQSTPSPCYKFEVMSPTDRDPSTAMCDDADRSFTYVTTVEHAGNFPVSDEIREAMGNVPISQREMKRKISSIDPLEVKHSKLTDSNFKND